MDQVTQAVLGAAVAYGALKSLPKLKQTPDSSARLGVWAGGLGGLLPDADMYIRTSSNLIGYGDYHRGFAHSLAFVPIGGAIAALLLMPIPWFRKRWKLTWLAAAIGTLTHGPLDTLTSYGTMLFWPFSRSMISLDSISIVDLLFTVPLLLGLTLAIRRNKIAYLHGAALFCAFYVGLGFVQKSRALEAQKEFLEKHGQSSATHRRVIPSYGNMVLWRTLHEHDGRIHSNAVFVLPFAAPRWLQGNSLVSYTAADLPAEWRSDPQIGPKLEFFQWFAEGYAAVDANDPTLIVDTRYSSEIARMTPLWGVRITPTGQPKKVDWVEFPRNNFEQILRFAGQLFSPAQAKPLEQTANTLSLR